MFVLTKKINDLYFDDEFQPVIVYGGTLGIGKSSYSFKATAEAYGTHIENGEVTVTPDWRKVKEYLTFPPWDFVDKCFKMIEQNRREKVLIWDDAGLWLNSMDWNHPFVKAVIKYLNVARTNWGCIIFTTPTPNMVVKRLRGFPDRITIKIIKTGSNKKNPNKPRRAVAYRNWTSPDLKHTGVRKIWEDDFSALMPDDFYDWYKPIRDEYAAMAVKMMKEELRELRYLGQDLTHLAQMIQKNHHI